MRSEDDQGVPTGIPSVGQRPEAGPSRDREAPFQFGYKSDHCPVVPCVGDEQDQSLRTNVGLLGRGFALMALDVVEMGDRFHHGIDIGAVDDCICAAPVTRHRDRDLRPPPQRGAETRPESPQQRQVTLVAHGLTGRIERRGELKADGSGKAAEDVDRHDLGIGPFDSTSDLARHSGHSTQLTKAQSTRPAGGLEV